MTGEFVARTPEQARLLLDEACQKLLGPLIRAEHSAGEVAALAGLPLKGAHHRLTRLVGAGLVDITGERPRGGRPVKRYRAAGRTFRVPFALTEAATLAELLEVMLGPFIRDFARQIGRRFAEEHGHELVLGAVENGRIEVSLNPRVWPREDYGALGTFGKPHLRPDTRHDLERKLRELYDWAMARDAEERGTPDAAPCLLGLFFTPQPGPE